jgi:hypothetical protein
VLSFDAFSVGVDAPDGGAALTNVGQSCKFCSQLLKPTFTTWGSVWYRPKHDTASASTYPLAGCRNPPLPSMFVEQDSEPWRSPWRERARAMTPEELAALLAASYSTDPRYRHLRGGPVLAVLDTSIVRTALHHQLTHGALPASLWSAQNGSVRLFMEYDTLVETQHRLPRFAAQFRVPVDELTRIINGWLQTSMW